MGTAQAIIRALRPTDSLEEITELLHRAYNPLADAGLRYLASHQSVDQTRGRLERAAGAYVAELGGRLVGTIKWNRGRPEDAEGPLIYREARVAIFGQFAVEPALQRHGIGLLLLNQVFVEAKQTGCVEVALDTAEGAAHLIRWYERLGFQFVEHTQWKVTNYRSVVMSRTL